MKDGMYIRGEWRPLPEDEGQYRGKASWFKRAWWVLAMGAVMVCMAIVGLFCRRGKAR